MYKRQNRGGIAWVYAFYKLNSGGYGFEVMSFEDVENHKKKFSKAAQKGFSPWQTSWEEMAKKTVIKRALKYAPLRTDFVRAVTECGVADRQHAKDRLNIRVNATYSSSRLKPSPRISCALSIVVKA